MKLKQIKVDGYKNLINSVVNLGDFNILVGPNNSGKSNLLEVFNVIWQFCFGNEQWRLKLFDGADIRFPGTMGTCLCKLKAHENKPITMGIVYEKTIHDAIWSIEYELTAQCASNITAVTKGFEHEKLTAKPISRPGPETIYIERSKTECNIKDQQGRKIDRMISALSSMKVWYPNYEGVPEELKSFVSDISQICERDTYLIYSLVNPRLGLIAETDIKSPPGFGILQTIDNLYSDTNLYQLFKEAFIDILDLEDAKFFAEDHKISGGKADQETVNRFRSFALKQKGGAYGEISEFSDGTITVARLLSELMSSRRKSPIMSWEEIENSLHPAALEKLIRFLQNNSDKWPVLLTTHSSYVLNLTNPVDVNIAVVDETGATHFEKITDRRKINAILNNKYMSFGDELVNNFEDLLKTKKD
jgi:energy-coupling factor transporter ATP-binding protein EcfA2